MSLAGTEPGPSSQKGLTGFQFQLYHSKNTETLKKVMEPCKTELKKALRHCHPEKDKSNFIKREKERLKLQYIYILDKQSITKFKRKR